MRYTLKDYQQDAVRDILGNLAEAREMFHNPRLRRTSQFALTATTGAGKTVMAAAVIEALHESSEPAWHQVDLEILPGVSASLATAAQAGAPLGHDDCVMSLSDNLKPWDVITRRLRLVAEAGLVIALYNPISKARPWQLGKAFDILREILPTETPVIFGRAAGRPDERMLVMPLGEADAERADMATCVVIGSPETRIIARPDLPDLVYPPRFLKDAS